MTKIIKPGVGRKFSRDEGFWFILNTLKESSGFRANIVDTINYVEQKLIFRTIEAGEGISIDIVNTGQLQPDGVTPYTKLIITNTMQEGVNVEVNGFPVGTQPATTINFEGNFSAVQTSPGNIKLTLESIAPEFSISYLGSKINTSSVQNINFQGTGVVVTETSAGYVDITINQSNSIQVFENGVPVSSNPFSILNFIAASGTITHTSGNIVDINLLNNAGFNNIENYLFIHTGSIVTSGSVVISGYFGSVNPEPKNVIVHINGLALEYDTNFFNSDFSVSGNNLILNIDNIGFPLDNGDKIQAYYWMVN
ncbi:MAG: hypothetical protein QXG00_05780 [Candidatus Woesearchaeota archaeon]